MYRKIVRKHSEVVIIVSSKVDKLMQENKNQNVDMVLAMNYLNLLLQSNLWICLYTLDVIFKFSLAPGALPVMLAKLSTCNHPLRPYLPNCTECTRYLSSTGRFVNILLGPTKYEEFVMRDNLNLFLPCY